MLHKVSDLCDRVDAIKSLSDTLRLIKYGEHSTNKNNKPMIDNLIAQIQYMCYTIHNDKKEYKKWKNTE